MSPRRRLLVLGLAALLLVGAVFIGVRVLGSRASEPAGPPPQDVPGPVLLVPGYGGDTAALGELAGRIAAAGRDVRVLELPGDGTGDLGAQVRVLGAAVADALAAGALSVDMVGYSAGGVVTALWIAREDSATAGVRRVVTLGAPLNGTRLAGAGTAAAPDACPAACRQIAPGSAELAELAGVGSRVPWLSVWTTDDETVIPPDTARLPGATNVAVQDVCPGARVGHGELPADPAVTGLVLDWLGAGPAGVADCAAPRAAG